MSQRENIDLELKGSFIMWFISLLLLVSILPLIAFHRLEIIMGVFPIALLLQVLAFMKAGRIKCSNCEHAFGPAIWYGRSLRAGGMIRNISNELCHCPGCGVPLDDTISS